MMLNSSLRETSRPKSKDTAIGKKTKANTQERNRSAKILGQCAKGKGQKFQKEVRVRSRFLPPLATMIDSRSFVSAIGLPTILTLVRRRNPAEFVDVFSLRDAFAPSWLSYFEMSLIKRPEEIESTSQLMVNTGIPRAMASSNAGVRFAFGDRTNTEACSADDDVKPLK